MLLEMEKSIPTPRRVNELLAAIGIHHATRCGSISIVSVAAYTLIADSLTPGTLATVSRPGGTFDEEQWREECAALFYRVDIESAQHMIRRPEIEAALLTGNGAQLAALSGAVGFVEVCEHFVRGKVKEVAATPLQLLNVAGAFGMLVPDESHARIWHLLAEAANNVERWPVDVDLTRIAPILRRASQEQRAIVQRRLLKMLGNGRESRDDEAAASDFSQWLANLKEILEATPESPPPADAFDAITGSPRFRLEVLRAVVDTKLVWPVVPPIVTADDDELRKLALDVAASARWADYRDAIARLIRFAKDWQWRPTLQAAENMCAMSSTMRRHRVLGQIIEFCLLLEDVTVRPEVIEFLETFAANGGAFFYLVRMTREPAAAWLVAVLVTRRWEIIGNEVLASAVDAQHELAADEWMNLLRHPEEDAEFLERVTTALDRIHAGGGDVAARMRTLASIIDDKGGLQFRVVYPEH